MYMNLYQAFVHNSPIIHITKTPIQSCICGDVQVDAEDGDPKSFVFQSSDALTNEEKLMVLIHGSGVVRAGQWARRLIVFLLSVVTISTVVLSPRLIINDCLDSGTQLPFIKKAKEVQSPPLFVVNEL